MGVVVMALSFGNVPSPRYQYLPFSTRFRFHLSIASQDFLNQVLRLLHIKYFSASLMSLLKLGSVCSPGNQK